MNSQYGNFGAGYLPTGATASPGLYNMQLYNAGWLPSWANLKGGIMGPLYAPQIRDPEMAQAIMRGAWNFPMSGSMFDPQGNSDLGPGAIPNHYYDGRSMTLHGFGGVGDVVADVLAFPMQVFHRVMGWVDSLSPFWKVVYWAAVGVVGIKALQMTRFGRRLVGGLGLSRLPVVGAVIRKNFGKRKARKTRARKHARRTRRNTWGSAGGGSDGRSYKIVRMYYGDRRPRTIKRGLTLEEAQAHTRDPKTKKEGEWFDGFEAEKTKRSRR